MKAFVVPDHAGQLALELRLQRMNLDVIAAQVANGKAGKGPERPLQLCHMTTDAPMPQYALYRE